MTRRVMAVLFVVLVVAIVAGVAVAVVGDDGPIHACARNRDGRVRVVDAPEECRRWETPLALASYASVEALEDALSALSARVDDLEERVAALENPPVPGPVAYWSFDDQVSPTADGADDHDATVVGAVFETTDVAPIAGNVAALRLDGVDDYAWAPDPDGANNLDGFSELTLAGWIKPDTLTSPWGSRIIVSKYFSASPTNSISYWLLQRGDEVEVHVTEQFPTPGGDGLTSNGVDLVPGEWYHVAGTWDGSTFRLYVGGDQVATKSTSVSVMDDSAVQVDIGAAEAFADGERSALFSGLLDEVYIFDTALSPREIATLAGR